MALPTHTSQLAPCKVRLRRIELVRGVWVVVNEGIVPALRRVRRRYEAADGYDRYLIRQRDTGAYNCRKTTSGASWSKHSYGCAIDVNWTTNPYGRQLVTDMPPWFRQIWLDEGFGWGGNWSGAKDAMHFSRFPNEGGNGLLEYDDGQEDDMAQVPQDEWDAMKQDMETVKERTSITIVKNGKKVPMGTDHILKAIAVKEGWLNPDGTWDGP